MDANNEAIDKSNEIMNTVAEALIDLADDIDDCLNPSTGLFDSDAFWVEFDNRIRPLVKTVKDNQIMDR